ncbi:unnamed protein product [Cyprideis torosa]|uniref:Phosphatidylserine synthase n=1 Tax=Cyprideis torosa TaxID=163714 RepID=A0A7R8WCU8_9CRUS|nr:unnamed protein product [Cyprideis torosa]CAG0888752.1 unnamed protein product [Cyprideis torosa]
MDDDHFIYINERPVDDISLEIFYKPHTLSLLLTSITGLVYFAFTRNEESLYDNILAGILAASFFFLVISLLAAPNGPFVRPHPAVWRLVFGLSVLYLMFLMTMIFQNYQTVRGILVHYYPELRNFSIDHEKVYGEDCNPVTWEKLWSHVDVFAFAHFSGWVMKAILVRHYGILWTISIMWEVTEVLFSHLLPNFIECWWDAFGLDVLLCNGLGIYVGMQICRYLEMRDYHWESVRTIRTTRGKIKRCVLQFTPHSWTQVRWLQPESGFMRMFAMWQLIVFWMLSELNTFFLKHILETPPDHPLVIARILFLGLIVAPTVRQYYGYVTDSRCRRMGTQCWIFVAITLAEAVLCVKLGKDVFAKAQLLKILAWLILLGLASALSVFLSVLWGRWREGTAEELWRTAADKPVEEEEEAEELDDEAVKEKQELDDETETGKENKLKQVNNVKHRKKRIHS